MQIKDFKSLHFLAIKMPKVHESNTQIVSLLAIEISKEFSVSLKDFNGIHIMTLDNKKKQSDGFSPFIWKVVDEYKEMLNHKKNMTPPPKQTSRTRSQKVLQTFHQVAQCNKQQKHVKENKISHKPTRHLKCQREGIGNDENDDKVPPLEGHAHDDLLSRLQNNGNKMFPYIRDLEVHFIIHI
jgi:ribonuclease D